jgi:hypothetical protein
MPQTAQFKISGHAAKKYTPPRFRLHNWLFACAFQALGFQGDSVTKGGDGKVKILFVTSQAKEL